MKPTRLISSSGVSPQFQERTHTLAEVSDGQTRYFAGETRSHHNGDCALGGSVTALGGQLETAHLSAEARLLTANAHFSTCSSPELDHFSVGAGFSVLEASLTRTYGDENNNLSFTAGTSFGMGGGFDYTRRANPNGSTTYQVNAGVALAERIGVGATLTTLTSDERQQVERDWAASGLGDPANVGP